MDELEKKLLRKVQQGCIKFVKRLISEGVNVNCRGPDDFTPLHFAVNSLNFPIIKLLVDAGADVNARAWNNETPLHAFYWLDDHKKNDKYYRVLRLLLTRGANINALDSDNASVLHWVSLIGNLKLVNYLLRHGADINVFNRDHMGILHCACANGNRTLIKMLMERGCDINYPPYTMLHLACKYEVNIELVKFLIENGANPNAVDATGIVPIFHLLKSSDDDPNLIRFMLKYTNLDFQTADGRHILNYYQPVCNWKLIVEHIAKLKALDRHVRPEILQTIDEREKYKYHFDNCVEELEKAKGMRSPGCWITFFHFLTIEGNKLIKIAKNESLVKDIESRSAMFPIYKEEFLRRMKMAVDIRSRKDKHAALLMECVPQLPLIVIDKILYFLFEYDEDD